MSKEKKDPALKDGGKAEKNNEAQEARENYQDCASGQEREEQPLKEAGDNYRRRNAAVYADALLEGKLEVIKGLLPVLDNLDRALAGEQEGSGSLYEGLVMIRKQLIDLIHSMGVEEIGAEGEAFDPNYHNAVMQSDCASGQKPGEIAEVLIKGYKLGDKIVRHTMVRVTK